MIWSYFPRNKRIPDTLTSVVNVFDTCKDAIDSRQHQLESNMVLSTVSDGLTRIGYLVEASKKNADLIKMPVLFGENGQPVLNFEADAFHPDHKVVIEVEAGRAVTNYQFLKDFFEACCMHDADYLCIAVREIYYSSEDYKKVCRFFDALYASERFCIPLKGILVIGY